MIQKLNQVTKKKDNSSYSYTTDYGTWASSDDKIPTNDKKYEKIYKFDDGKIYRETEIIANKLDTNYTIRRRLNEKGQPLNKAEISGYEYVNANFGIGLETKIASIDKSRLIEISCAQNYNSYGETATTWYTYESFFTKMIFPKEKLGTLNFKSLNVQFASDDDFSSILKQIIAVSKYIDTKEDYAGSFESEYKYGLFKITSKKSDKGGSINIYLPQ